MAMAEARGIVARIQQISDRLTQTEQKLVSCLLADPQSVALGSSADFAARASAHEATTSRFARKLGFQSYADFRKALREEWLQMPEPAARMSSTLADGSGWHLAGIIDAEIAGLAALGRHLDQSRIEHAAAMIDRPRLFLFAHGNATVLAVMMERRLRRMGVLPVLMTASARDLAEQTVGIGPNDCVLLFAFRRQPRHWSALVKAARERGATTVAISDTLGPALTPQPDLLLSAPRSGGETGFQTLTVPMVICNALVLALGARRKDNTLQTLEDLGALIRRFEI